MAGKGGDREFVDLLLLAEDHGIEVVETACELAVEQNTLRLPAIINLINQLVEPVITPLSDAYTYPQLTLRPEASSRFRCDTAFGSSCSIGRYSFVAIERGTFHVGLITMWFMTSENSGVRRSL